MNLTIITAEEQLHYENIRQLEVVTESDSTVTIGRGMNHSSVPIIPDSTVIITESLNPAAQERINAQEQKEPAMYILVLLDAFQEKKFWDEEECFARVNKENMEAVRYVLYEYSKVKRSYILSEYSSR